MNRLALILFLATTGACSEKPVMTEAPAVPGPTLTELSPGRLILPEKLHGAIALTNAKIRPAGTLTQAEAAIQNTSDDRYTVEYRFDWLDSSGFSVPTLTTWHRLTLTPGELRQIQSLGKSPQATRFQLTVRLPDDAFNEQQTSE